MANMPSIKVSRMTIRPSTALRAKIRTKVRLSNGQMTENDVVLLALEHELGNTTPDEADLEWAKEEERKNASMRHR